MINDCKTIIALEEAKLKFSHQSMNPPYILKNGEDISKAVPAHDTGFLPDGSRIEDRIAEIDKVIRGIVTMLYRSVEHKDCNE